MGALPDIKKSKAAQNHISNIFWSKSINVSLIRIFRKQDKLITFWLNWLCKVAHCKVSVSVLCQVQGGTQCKVAVCGIMSYQGISKSWMFLLITQLMIFWLYCIYLSLRIVKLQSNVTFYHHQLFLCCTNCHCARKIRK